MQLRWICGGKHCTVHHKVNGIASTVDVLTASLTTAVPMLLSSLTTGCFAVAVLVLVRLIFLL